MSRKDFTISGQSPLTIDDAEFQQFVYLRVDGCLLFSGMVPRWEAVARHDILSTKAPQLFLKR